MTDRRPSPSYEGPPPSDPMMGEPTLVQMDGMGFTLILERGEDSQGDEPVIFMPGKQQGPLSVGRKGQFCLDGRGVLPVHAYLMWDGKAFHVASADEASPVVVEGIRITKEWTRVEPPCGLLFGRTAMTLRMVTTAEPTIVYHATDRREPLAIPRHDYNLGRPLPITAPASESTVVIPPAYHDVTPSDPTRQIPVRPPFHGMDPSNLSNFGNDESTRLSRESAPLPVLRPASSDDESTRLHAEGWNPPHPAPRAPERLTGVETLAQEPTAPAPGRPIASSYIPAGEPGYVPPQASARQVNAPPEQRQGVPLDAAPRRSHSSDRPPETKRPPIAQRVSNDSQHLARKVRTAMAPGSSARVPIVVGGCAVLACMVVGLTVTLRNLARPAEIPVQQQSARMAPSAAPPAEPSAPVQPPQPEMVLYPAPPRKLDGGVALNQTDNPRKAIDAGPPTLERAAIDAINRGDQNAALAAYRQLAQQQPDNAAFANATRLLQQKLNAQSPPNR